MRYFRTDAAEVYDRTTAVFDHVGFDGLQHHHAADDVDVVTVEPVLAGRIQRVVDVNARQVDEEIDTTKLRYGTVYAGGNLGIIRQVSFNKQHILV